MICLMLYVQQMKQDEVKNFPDIFEKISDELKVPLSRTLFFDDSLSALVTAKKLGMKVVGVYDKYYASDKTEIIKVADGYIESWENVWNLL